MKIDELVESAVPLRMECVKSFLTECREQVLDGKFLENPFSTELTLYSVENWYLTFFQSPGWQDRPLKRFCPYSRWLSGKLRDWTPVAFSLGNVWSIEHSAREAFVASLRRKITSSFNNYQHTLAKSLPTLETKDCDVVVRMFRHWIRTHQDVGRLFTMFGGVLAVESEVRLIETAVERVLPEAYELLGWKYPHFDAGFQMYLGGFSRVETEVAFLKHWQSYVVECREDLA